MQTTEPPEQQEWMHSATAGTQKMRGSAPQERKSSKSSGRSGFPVDEGCWLCPNGQQQLFGHFWLMLRESRTSRSRNWRGFDQKWFRIKERGHRFLDILPSASWPCTTTQEAIRSNQSCIWQRSSCEIWWMNVADKNKFFLIKWCILRKSGNVSRC